METWKHLRAILLLPFMVTVVVPSVTVWLTGVDIPKVTDTFAPPVVNGKAPKNPTAVFDHSVHGLTVFLNAGRREGEGLPPLVPWACSACGGVTRRGRVHFRFPDRDDFLEYVAGECGLERWGDGLEWFGMKLACCGCGHEVNPWAGYED